MRNHNRTLGISLVELLLALAILSIVATVAVSESLQSKTRADVARVRTDMRKVCMALEAYAVDQGAYPHLKVYRDSVLYKQWGQCDRGPLICVTNLTSPVAYLANTYVSDPFSPDPVSAGDGALSAGWFPDFAANGYVRPTLVYMNADLYYKTFYKSKNPAWRPGFYLFSYGPDRIKGPDPRTGSSWQLTSYVASTDPDKSCRFLAWQYDPSNGTISRGDILGYSPGH